MYEQMGMASKADRFKGGGMERLGTGPFNSDLQTKQFDRLEQFAKLNAARGEVQGPGRSRHATRSPST